MKESRIGSGIRMLAEIGIGRIAYGRVWTLRPMPGETYGMTIAEFEGPQAHVMTRAFYRMERKRRTAYFRNR